MFFIRIFACLVLFLLTACPDPPRARGPGSGLDRPHYCELNDILYNGGVAYEAYCNPEGVKLYDSLKKDDEFAKQFYVEKKCKDTLNHRSYSLSYNSYTNYFDLMLVEEKSFNEMEKGHLYVMGQYCKFQTIEDMSADSIRCLIVNDENDDLKFLTIVPGELFPMDSIKILDEAETCEEQIAIVLSLFEMCEGRDLMN
jgi:hypothetical protein